MSATSKPGSGDRPVVPTADAWGRVAQAVKRVEGQSLSRTPRAGRGLGAWSNSGIIAKATTSISARSGATYGTGTIQIQKDTGSALADDTSQPTMGVKNLTKFAIDSGSYLFVGWALGSWWVLVPDDCDHLT